MKRSSLTLFVALWGVSAMAIPNNPLLINGESEQPVSDFGHTMRLERGMKSPEHVSADNEIIYTQPEGELVYYNRMAYCFFAEDDWMIFTQFNATANIVFGNDGYAYIYNPFGGFSTYSYLKCEIEGDQLIATLPQKIYADEYDSDYSDCYAVMLNKEENEDGKITYRLSDTTAVQTVSWTMEGDKITMNTDYEVNPDEDLTWPEKIFAIVNADGKWVAGGDALQEYDRLDTTPVVPPSDMLLEEWTMVATYQGRPANVGFYGDDVYIGNFSTKFPNAFIKGHREGDKVVFKSKQYIGTYSIYFVYFMAGTCDPLALYLADEIVFDFDAEKKILRAPENSCMYMNVSTDKLKSLETFEGPMIRSNDMDHTPQPMHPVPTSYGDYFEGGGYTYITFYLPNVNADGAILDTSNMYYEISIDGDEPFTFTPDEYGGIDEPMTRVPYNFTNGKNIVSSSGGVANVVFFYFIGYETVDIQLFNQADGITYSSPLTTYYVLENRYEVGSTVKVAETFIDKPVRSVEYYSIDGLKLDKPARGMNVCKVTMEDGSVKVTKVMAK